MEVKLTQQSAFIEQVPLYQIFIDLRKAYDAMEAVGAVMKIQAFQPLIRYDLYHLLHRV